MSNTRERKAEEALQEYLEAVKNYDRIHDKYFPGKPVDPDKPTTIEPITEEAIEELGEAKDQVTKAENKWKKLRGI